MSNDQNSHEQVFNIAVKEMVFTSIFFGSIVTTKALKTFYEVIREYKEQLT